MGGMGGGGAGALVDRFRDGGGGGGGPLLPIRGSCQLLRIQISLQSILTGCFLVATSILSDEILNEILILINVGCREVFQFLQFS